MKNLLNEKSRDLNARLSNIHHNVVEKNRKQQKNKIQQQKRQHKTRIHGPPYQTQKHFKAVGRQS